MCMLTLWDTDYVNNITLYIHTMIRLSSFRAALQSQSLFSAAIWPSTQPFERTRGSSIYRRRNRRPTEQRDLLKLVLLHDPLCI